MFSMNVSNQLLNEIISCPKTIIRAERKKMILENRHYRNTLNAISNNQKYTFKIFLRQFLEDFSVGLIWTNPQNIIGINRPIIMLRCQGPHDGKEELGFDIHHDFHTHEITEKDILERRFHRPSCRQNTTLFQSFDQALCYFIKRCDIIDIEKFIDFPDNFEQLTLF